MDDDLKEVLEAIREENAAAHAETRRRFEAVQAENVAAHAETRRRFETLEARFEAAQAETLRRFESAQAENAEAHIKTRRQFEVLDESNQHKLDFVAESVLSTSEKVDRLEAKVDQVTANHESRITRLEIAASLQGRI